MVRYHSYTFPFYPTQLLPTRGSEYQIHSQLCCLCIPGLIVNLVVYILEIPGLGDASYRTTASTLRTTFGLLLPHSALASALSHFGGTATYNAQCRNMPQSVKNFLCGKGAEAGLNFLGESSIACCGK